MNKDISPLFQPFSIGQLKLKNRIVMPPMVTHYGSDEGYVTLQMKNYYAERGRGGVGMIIVEAACIDGNEGLAFKNGLRIDDDRFLPGLSQLAGTIQATGAKASIQLHHGGSQALFCKTGKKAVSPSVIPSMTPTAEDNEARTLESNEIGDIVDSFANAAMLAQKAGFDCVEIHGAHFYLIAQFLSHILNQRTDSYGGSLKNRAKLLVEIIKAIKNRTGNDYPVLCRIDFEQLTPDGKINEAHQLARIIQNAGIHAIDVSVCGLIFASEPKTPPPEDIDRFAREIKQLVTVPVLSGGGVDYLEAARTIRENTLDLSTIGRALLADPELPNKIASGREKDINPCTDCRGCVNRVAVSHKPLVCSVNPQLGKEA